MSAEPTAEQRLWALTFVTRVLECETPEQIDDTERDLARALAAAVAAEREKVGASDREAAAEWLAKHHLMDHLLGTSAIDMDELYQDADDLLAHLAARRIREVSS